MKAVDDTHRHYMSLALRQARQAATLGEIPVGAIIVCRGHIIASAHNMTQQLNDVTAHAEILAITSAEATLGSKYLTDCTLYVTLEPCAMCAAAIGHAQIPEIVIAADDPKRGYTTCYSRSPFHPRAKVITGILGDEAGAILSSFFKQLRKKASKP